MENTRLSESLKYDAARRSVNNRQRWCYFVRCEQFVKIGITDTLEQRLQALQTGCPFEMFLLAAIPINRDSVETGFHKLFKSHRRRGEWFELPPETITLIALMGHDDGAIRHWPTKRRTRLNQPKRSLDEVDPSIKPRKPGRQKNHGTARWKHGRKPKD